MKRYRDVSNKKQQEVFSGDRHPHTHHVSWLHSSSSSRERLSWHHHLLHRLLLFWSVSLCGVRRWVISTVQGCATTRPRRLNPTSGLCLLDWTRIWAHVSLHLQDGRKYMSRRLQKKTSAHFPLYMNNCPGSSVVRCVTVCPDWFF